MLSPWFLLSLLLTLVRSFSVSRLHHPPTLVDWDTENPTCEQLLHFWTAVRRTEVMVDPETNEIPLMPANERIPTMPTVTGKHGKTYVKNEMGTYLNNLGLSKSSSIIRTPVLTKSSLLLFKPEIPSGPVSDGIFGDFHDRPSISSNHGFAEHGIPGNAGSVPLGDKKNAENENLYVPQWGSSKEVDSFGSFVDFDIRVLPAITRTPKELKADWSGLPTEDTQRNTLETCDVILSSACTANEQCFCRGWKKLKCFDGKCLDFMQSNDIEEKWHNGPVTQTQLRFLSIPRKSRKSIFM